MDGQPGQEDGEGAGPGRDPRLARFAWDDSQPAPVPSGRLALLLDQLSGPERRCPGANDDERAGLLPRPARQAGQRRYTEDILDRLALLEYAKNSGFKLEEIRRLFHGTREGVPLSARWRQLATAKISELDQQMRQIAVMKGLLDRALKCRCVDVEECGRSIRANRA